MFDDLRAAMERSDHETALALAIEAWRRYRLALLGDLVERLGERVKGEIFARGLDAAAHRARWLEVARAQRAVDVTALMKAFPRNLVQDFDWRERYQRRDELWDPLRERLQVLAEAPPDPRVARTVAREIVRGQWGTNWGGPPLAEMYGPALPVLRRHGDAAVVDVLRAALARPTAKTEGGRAALAQSLPSVVADLEDAVPIVPSAEESAALTALLSGFVDEAPSRSALVADVSARELEDRVYVDPDDDEARLVLADYLLERGDPRGELISLQFAARDGEPSEADEKRAASLVRKHQDDWLGEIALVTKKRVFARGFLESCELQQRSAADPAVWERVLVDRRLGTLRSLGKGDAAESILLRFLESPARRSLRELDAPSRATLEVLAASKEPYGIESLRLGRPLGKDAIRTLTSTDNLPRLRHLGAPGEPAKMLAAVRKARLHERLERLDLDVGYELEIDLRTWFAALPLLAPLRTIGVRGTATSARLTAADEGLEAQLESAGLWRLAEMVVALPAGLRSLSLSSPGAPIQVFGRADEAVASMRAALARADVAELRLDAAWSELLGLPRSSLAKEFAP